MSGKMHTIVDCKEHNDHRFLSKFTWHSCYHPRMPVGNVFGLSVCAGYNF